MNKFRRITLATWLAASRPASDSRHSARPAPRLRADRSADLDRHVDRMLKHLYVEIDAADVQKQKLDPIVRQAAKDLAPMRENLHAARREAIELLSQGASIRPRWRRCAQSRSGSPTKPRAD